MTKLETDRLILRPVRRSDAAAMLVLINNFEISKWLSRVAFPYEATQAEEFFVAVVDAQKPDHARPHAIELKEDPGRMIGCIGAEPHGIEDGILSPTAEFGYWLGQPFWGKGIASEAAAAMVPMGFAAGGYEKLTAGYLAGNAGSKRILETYGFVDCGPKTIFCAARGEDVDGRHMELSRERWATRYRSQD